jgi:hypothetical protein
MSALDLVKTVLPHLLPVRLGDLEFQGDVTAAVLDEDGVSLPLRLVQYEPTGIVRDIREQMVPIIEHAHVDDAPERLRAYLEGWARVLPDLMERAQAASGEDAMPHECVCPLALDGSASTPDGFALLLRESKPMKAACEARFADPIPYELTEETYAAFLAEEHQDDEDSKARRARALEAAVDAFEKASGKVREVFGLELPRSVMVFDAFWRSLSPAEKEAYKALELPTPVGLLEYLAPGGVERRVREGLDARLHWRWCSDPPELVTVFRGWGGDWQHFGLFYDDPAKLPSGVVVNYARDSAETWWKASTLLDVLRRELDSVEEEALTPEYHKDVARAACQVRLVREAINAFADVEEEALQADAPRLAMKFEDRVRVPEIVCGVGVLVPGVAHPLPYLAERKRDGSPFFGDAARTRRFVAEARAALERGEPAYALGLGRDLHWSEREEFRADTVDLLVRAYRMLGREALAAIVETENRHRDLPSVTVFED